MGIKIIFRVFSESQEKAYNDVSDHTNDYNYYYY